jgi:hypothetical protein
MAGHRVTVNISLASVTALNVLFSTCIDATIWDRVSETWISQCHSPSSTPWSSLSYPQIRDTAKNNRNERCSQTKEKKSNSLGTNY